MTGRAVIVVATHNRRDQLARTLPHHLALPDRPHVVVVDDGSTDGSAAAVSEAFPAVEVIRLERSIGSAARNVGARAAGTPYVAFTDDDAWWEPGAIQRACELMDAHPRLAVVQPHIRVGADERPDPVCAEMAGSPLPKAADQPGHPLLSFVACAVVVRVEAFLAAGGFHERFGVGGEEELLGWDLAAGGWLMSYAPEIAAHHDPPRSSRWRPQRRQTLVRNALWTTWLRRPLRAAVRQTIRDIAAMPRDRNTARGVILAIAGSLWLVRERRVTPPHVQEQQRLLSEHKHRSSPTAQPSR
jgi:N-acetylglucosaminyl-diphospho-decaprenol L-rhamnosyltransferase